MTNIQHTAILAALEAGKAILAYYYHGRELAIVTKDDHTPVTDADLESNRIIERFLAPTGYPVLSEENREVPFEVRRNWGTCWIVDPLDGTREFLKRNGEFTVNIALCENSKAVFGVIYAPVSGALYYGDSREGKAYKTVCVAEKDNTQLVFWQEQDRIFPGPRNPDTVRILVSRSHMNAATREYVDCLSVSGKVELIEKGSALKFGWLAEGKADLYPRFGPTMEWDTAAGSAITEATGFQMTVPETGEPLAYNRENLRNPNFLVARP